jgi:hypothetical protein
MYGEGGWISSIHTVYGRKTEVKDGNVWGMMEGQEQGERDSSGLDRKGENVLSWIKWEGESSGLDRRGV